MTWQFQQSTGAFTQNGVAVADGYSGHGPGVNNPDLQDIRNVGPIPRGRYTIGAPKNPPDFLGPLAMPLTPEPTNMMFGRGAFFIHGDNVAMDDTASDGCIILPHAVRLEIATSADRELVVVA